MIPRGLNPHCKVRVTVPYADFRKFFSVEPTEHIARAVDEGRYRPMVPVNVFHDPEQNRPKRIWEIPREDHSRVPQGSVPWHDIRMRRATGTTLAAVVGLFEPDVARLLKYPSNIAEGKTKKAYEQLRGVKHELNEEGMANAEYGTAAEIFPTVNLALNRELIKEYLLAFDETWADERDDDGVLALDQPVCESGPLYISDSIVVSPDAVFGEKRVPVEIKSRTLGKYLGDGQIDLLEDANSVFGKFPNYYLGQVAGQVAACRRNSSERPTHSVCISYSPWCMNVFSVYIPHELQDALVEFAETMVRPENVERVLREGDGAVNEILRGVFGSHRVETFWVQMAELYNGLKPAVTIAMDTGVPLVRPPSYVRENIPMEVVPPERYASIPGYDEFFK